MVKLSLLTKILPVCCVLFACVGPGDDSSPAGAPLEIHRFERALFAIDTTQFAASMQKLAERYPSFFNTHFRNIFGVIPGDTVQMLSGDPAPFRSEEHTSELQSLMRISYAVFCLKKKKKIHYNSPKHN